MIKRNNKLCYSVSKIKFVNVIHTRFSDFSCKKALLFLYSQYVHATLRITIDPRYIASLVHRSVMISIIIEIYNIITTNLVELTKEELNK